MTEHANPLQGENEEQQYAFNCTNKYTDITSLYNEEHTEKSNTFYNSYLHVILRHNNILKLNKNNFILFTNMEIIDLSYNNLTIINKDLFMYNTKLTAIKLSNNNIKDFHLNLTYLNVLNIISIKNNSIKTLQEYIFRSYLSKANRFDISYNNISCDCSMSWLRKLNKEYQPSHIEIADTDTCTLDIHNDVNVLCFIYETECNITINEKHCIIGK